jgi:ATP-dependent Lon protease
VMRESATAGLSYIRSRAEKYELKPDFYDNMEIHIHVPEGAVPKDGPSAGITIMLALLSALTKKPIRPGIAFTGEITLSGDVLPIGGLNEKLLAAKRLGIMDVALPFKNKKDIPELPKELVADMNLMPVKSADEVIKIAFNKLPNTKKVSPKQKR